MKSLLVLLVLITGCAGQRHFVASGFKPITLGQIRIHIREDGTTFAMTNTTGHELHNVKLKVTVWDGEQYWQCETESLGDWSNLETRESVLKFNRGIGSLEILGWCKEGKIKVDWDAAVTRLD